VVPEGGQHAFVERLMRAYDKDMPRQKRILEVNGEHPVIRNLAELHRTGQAGRVDAWIELLMDQVLLSEGSPVEDPARLARRMTELLVQVSGAALQGGASGGPAAEA
jgi:molecular chaperone HtpG